MIHGENTKPSRRSGLILWLRQFIRVRPCGTGPVRTVLVFFAKMRTIRPPVTIEADNGYP